MEGLNHVTLNSVVYQLLFFTSTVDSAVDKLGTGYVFFGTKKRLGRIALAQVLGKVYWMLIVRLTDLQGWGPKV